MFSTINDTWEVVENIVEKWGFSPNDMLLATCPSNF
jgi:hypothetical protein